MNAYVIGRDFGTNSAGALFTDVKDGREVANSVHEYESGTHGIVLNPVDPHLARQNSADGICGLENSIKNACRETTEKEPGIAPSKIIGVGADYAA